MAFEFTARRRFGKAAQRRALPPLAYRTLRFELLEARTLLSAVPFSAQIVIQETNTDGAASVFASDLDGDGDPDVLSASVHDNKIAWYENRLDEATATFGPQQVITTSADGAKSVFATDLDGDGDPDVLSASSGDGKIAWYENRLDEATANFGPQQVITTSARSAESVFATDLDGDGDADVLSASETDGMIAWYENRLGEATADFGPLQMIITSTDGAQSVFATDLDGDGDADVLSALARFRGNTNHGKIVWYENRLDEATAEFGPQQVITTSAYGAFSVFATDLDGDGDPDVLSASVHDNKIAWYENRLDEATANFGPEQVISTSAIWARSVFAMDLDGDGDGDVLSASLLDGKIAWYRNERIGTVGDMDLDTDVDLDDVDDFVQGLVDPDAYAADHSGLSPAARGDVDGDGDLDVDDIDDFVASLTGGGSGGGSVATTGSIDEGTANAPLPNSTADVRSPEPLTTVAAVRDNSGPSGVERSPVVASPSENPLGWRRDGIARASSRGESISSLKARDAVFAEFHEPLPDGLRVERTPFGVKQVKGPRSSQLRNPRISWRGAESVSDPFQVQDALSSILPKRRQRSF